ncbi:hypothetical protein BFN03_04145 [Rhodococcus sp. WMMA185]|uniref:DUF2510 domain-containing protein n=1 Tax=Rhodococcus sp. WMMA185 TaxID=679318 RepID=UPI000878906E|nr:DUF2510 domain-containing protein [Rhodococcus sp. WMMA185]AOW94406.1 hypothetical protein BFN03_04145 [Rhodococcus sp. WMMA185]
MSEQPDTVPAGWYPAPDGGQRYWDGTKWLDIPEPETKSSSVSRKRPSKKVLIAIAVVGLVAVGGGTIWKVSHDASVRAEQEAVALAAQIAADEEAARLANERAAQEAEDENERALRARAVTGIESSVQEMAEEHVEKGFMTGPVLDVSCSPVGGGSTDDLTEVTTVFQCFAATKDNGDGSMSGFNYHATMNWNTGEYTYGRGAP